MLSLASVPYKEGLGCTTKVNAYLTAWFEFKLLFICIVKLITGVSVAHFYLYLVHPRHHNNLLICVSGPFGLQSTGRITVGYDFFPVNLHLCIYRVSLSSLCRPPPHMGWKFHKLFRC